MKDLQETVDTFFKQSDSFINKLKENDMDKELFELCKEVYKRTGWGNKPDETESFYVGSDDTGYKRRFIRGVPRVSNTYPYYTSDYLLDKLPKAIDLKKTFMDKFGSQELEWFYEAICYGFDGNNLIEHADTPLKSLLKLTIALHAAGELTHKEREKR